jgi:hypothetical protein
MSKVIFAGASITAGYGWNIENEHDRSSPHMWVNLVHENIPELKKLEKLNIAEHGITNTVIFKKVVNSIVSVTDVKYIFCSWVHLVRHELGLGFDHERYIKLELCPGGDFENNIILPNRTYRHSVLNKIKNNFLSLHHDHYEICKIIEYVNIINSLCKKYNIQVFHINDSCSWDQDYFNKITDYTKNSIIEVENRSKNEIEKIYDLIQCDYKNLGGIQEHSWINLYDSFTDNIIDRNFDKNHPGISSNKIYYEMVKNKFNQ